MKKPVRKIKKKERSLYNIASISIILILVIMGIGLVILTNTSGREFLSMVFANNSDSSLQMGTFQPSVTVTPIPSPTPIPPPATDIPTQTPPSLGSPVQSTGQPASSGSVQPTAPVTSTPILGCTQQDIQKLVDNVSEAKIREYETNLVDNKALPGADEKGTRYVTKQGNIDAINYIKSHFDSIGVQNYLQPYTYSGLNLNNAIAKVTGKDPNSYYVIGGHMDAMSPSKDPAPAADDDGSGTALAMEAARVLKDFAPCLKVSIEFAAFNGEEIGLTGSAAYVKNLGSKKILGYFNSDMVGTPDSGQDCVNFNYKPYTAGDVLAKKLGEVNTKYGINLGGQVKTDSGASSDHASFQDVGIPAADIFECQFSPVYHDEHDDIEHLSISEIVKTTKAVVAAVAEMASQ